MEVKVEKVNPYRNDQSKKEQIRQMFDSIAPAYDLMNRAMTFGLDKSWRDKAVGMVARRNPRNILDVATGTGDFAISLARRIPSAKVTGIDLSARMVDIGLGKVDAARLSDSVELLVGDCLELPFADGSFDCITVAFGVRNFEKLLEGYRQIFRVLRPGGMLCVLELSTPESALVLPFYRFYTRRLIPLLGRLVSKDARAYSYLPESIAAVPQGIGMTSLIKEAGFSSCSCQSLSLGICSIYSAFR